MTQNCLPRQVRSEARLEAQARIASLEASLRRTELDAQDRIRQAELAHFKESRASQLSVVEAQNQRQRERLEREAFEEKTRDAIRKELAHAHATELAELEALRRARGVGDNDVVMSRKQVAALQQQLAEPVEATAKLPFRCREPSSRFLSRLARSSKWAKASLYLKQ